MKMIVWSSSLKDAIMFSLKKKLQLFCYLHVNFLCTKNPLTWWARQKTQFPNLYFPTC